MCLSTELGFVAVMAWILHVDLSNYFDVDLDIDLRSKENCLSEDRKEKLRFTPNPPMYQG